MDASKLLTIVSDIDEACKGGITQSLKELIAQYTAARDTPATDNSPAIQEVLDRLSDAVQSGPFSDYPPSKLSILNKIDRTGLVGNKFLARLNSLLGVAGQTTAGIVTGLTQLQSDLEAFRKGCAQTKTGLEALGIEPYVIPEGEFEVGVLIPEPLVDAQLGAFTKELETWNKILRGFQEAAGEDDREVKISQISSGSFEIYIPIGCTAAYLLSRTIDKVLEWYSKILEIRKHRLELKELGAPVAETNGVKKHEKDLLEKEIASLAKELIKSANLKAEAGRTHELETHLTISIRQVARFVDKGGIVEVDSNPPESPEEPEVPEGDDAEEKKQYEQAQKEFKKLQGEFEKVSKILEAGRALHKLPKHDEEILQIGPDDEGSSTEKDGKRK